MGDTDQARRPSLPEAAEQPPAPVVRVMAAVLQRGDRLLVCQRPAHKRHGGLWEFPGGKCEPGETDADALRRELHEELGIEFLAAERPRFATRDAGSPFLIVFVPVAAAGEPACREHSELRWATVEEISRLALAPSDRRFVEFLAAAEVEGSRSRPPRDR